MGKVQLQCLAFKTHGILWLYKNGRVYLKNALRTSSCMVNCGTVLSLSSSCEAHFLSPFLASNLPNQVNRQRYDRCLSYGQDQVSVVEAATEDFV